VAQVHLYNIKQTKSASSIMGYVNTFLQTTCRHCGAKKEVGYPCPKCGKLDFGRHSK